MTPNHIPTVLNSKRVGTPCHLFSRKSHMNPPVFQTEMRGRLLIALRSRIASPPAGDMGESHLARGVDCKLCYTYPGVFPLKKVLQRSVLGRVRSV